MFLFPASEIALAVFKRANPEFARIEDRGSLRLLWLVIGVSVLLAIGLGSVGLAPLHLSPRLHGLLAAVLILSGLSVRWAAILTLGSLFTVDVAIHEKHRLVENGLYRYVRHPSYSGLLIAFVGLGVYFGDWLSVGALLLPITLVLVNRIEKEERALLASFGSAYAAYAARTKRLIPGIL